MTDAAPSFPPADGFIRACPDAIAGVTPDGLMVIWNPAAERLLGAAAADMIGQPFLRLVPPERQNQTLAALALVRGSGATEQIESAWMFGDGRAREVSLTLFPARDAGDAIVGVYIMVRDVSAGNQAARERQPRVPRMRTVFEEAPEPHEVPDALRAAEMQFQTLVEQLPAGVYARAVNATPSSIYTSPRLVQMLGYAPDDPNPLPNVDAWLAQVHPDDRPRLVQELGASAGAAPEQQVIEYQFRRKDGSYIRVQDVHRAMRNPDGALIARLGIMLDITVGQETRETMMRLAAIVEAADSAIFARTLDGRITYWNAAAERLYGYTRAEAVGQPIAILSPDGSDSLHVNPGELVRMGVDRYDSRHVRKDGSVVDVEVLLFPVQDETGEVFSVAGFCQDVSGRIAGDHALRAALQAAEAGSRAKSLFLTMMSHELRTPLQAILGYAEFLLHDYQQPLAPMQREDIRLIYEGAHRINRLVTQLLDLSRLQVDELHLQVGPVETGPLLAQLKSIIQARALAHGLAVAISAPASLPPVLGDADRVREILLNLLDNALKFTAAGGITISARARQAHVDIAVQDTGIGIAPEDLAHIFEEFRQAEELLTRRHDGAGLGLTVARQLAKAMGGNIVAQSTPGVGSLFTLRLPVATGPDQPPGSRSPGSILPA